MLKVQRSAQWLADHFAEVPLFLFAFVQGDPTGGSIYPAVWSAQLAARAQGVGSSLTAVLGFWHPDETFEILGVPTDDQWIMACCVSFGYPTGRWGVADAPTGPGGLLPQPLGDADRLRGRRAALVARVDLTPRSPKGRGKHPGQRARCYSAGPESRGCSSMVEPLISNQMTRVRSPSAARRDSAPAPRTCGLRRRPRSRL